MARHDFRDLITSVGHCCPYEFFETYKRWTKPKIAAYLGISTRAIQAWRAKRRAGLLKCEKCKTCKKDYLPPPKEFPISFTKSW